MNMGMSLGMTPMIFCGLECTECGQLLSKPANCATNNDVIEAGVMCNAIDPWSVTIDKCPKCGQIILKD